jgi:hypothetical protein
VNLRMSPRIRLLVNAIPMVNVNTRISRYLRSLYAEMERAKRFDTDVFVKKMRGLIEGEVSG